MFYVYFFIPETKGLTLEEVDEMYRSGVKPWKSAGWVPSHKYHDAVVAGKGSDMDKEEHAAGGNGRFSGEKEKDEGSQEAVEHTSRA